MSLEKSILIASDHAGVIFKSEIKKGLPDWTWNDLGPQWDASQDPQKIPSIDYPDSAQKLGELISCGKAELGILICGSGIGMSIAANKVNGVRAAVVENPVAARLAREHNHANVLCLGSRFIAPEYALEIIRAWLTTPVDSNARHLRRIEKIHRMEAK